MPKLSPYCLCACMSTMQFHVLKMRPLATNVCNGRQLAKSLPVLNLHFGLTRLVHFVPTQVWVEVQERQTPAVLFHCCQSCSLAPEACAAQRAAAAQAALCPAIQVGEPCTMWPPVCILKDLHCLDLRPVAALECTAIRYRLR